MEIRPGVWRDAAHSRPVGITPRQRAARSAKLTDALQRCSFIDFAAKGLADPLPGWLDSRVSGQWSRPRRWNRFGLRRGQGRHGRLVAPLGAGQGLAYLMILKRPLSNCFAALLSLARR
jgi:hypothetical protein